MPEAHALLATANPTSLPAFEVVEKFTIPSSVALSRFSVARWRLVGKNSEDYLAIDSLLTHCFTDGKLLSLQPKALAFYQQLKDHLETLNFASLEKFGCVTGDVYDEVFGKEGSESRTAVPSYLPSVSYFQNNFHNIFLNKELKCTWIACATSINPQISSRTADHAYAFLLSFLQDVSFAHLVATLLGSSTDVPNFL
uniref:Uncharacterized protein n=1 Tax=Polytomella parva TaxID=51329 RepID=A0A7S0UW77_9CHLO|mmetsp:Transcript_20137/g.36173  ORF Transcript_20137/g.36173 Transcript_20137/m.36173 type:complete len:197 (+) Transcript_20137:109-699(+)